MMKMLFFPWPGALGKSMLRKCLKLKKPCENQNYQNLANLSSRYSAEATCQERGLELKL